MGSTLQLQQLNGFHKMVPETDRAYIAGLFDGEGSIHFKRGIEKKKKHQGKPGHRKSNSMRISM